MISTNESQALEQLTSAIHFQILREHGTVPSDAHALALSALHQQLCQMVNGERSSWHGRWCLSAPIGFGKSGAAAAFLPAAWQLGLLGNGITLTMTAARVEQLYDFENAMLDAGIPKDIIRRYVSVLHNVPTKKGKAHRPSDTNTDAPILLITQARIRQVYRRDEAHKERDLTYFLKFKGEPRDLVLWDERAQVTESISIPFSQLSQSLSSLADKTVAGDKPSHAAFIKWLSACVGYIDREMTKLHAVSSQGLREDAGLLTDMPKGDTQAFYSLLRAETPNLNFSARETLSRFIETLRFKVRIAPLPGRAGVITYSVVIPDCVENCLVLDASYGVSELTQMDVTIQNLERAHPRLLEMKRRHGKELKDLKDCSDQTFIHWNKGAGKDAVSRDLKAYLDGTAKGGNLILEVVEQVKQWQAQGKAILVWCHKADKEKHDLTQLLRDAFDKAGIDRESTVVDPYSRTQELKPQVVVENYGKHDASNTWSYCSVVAHVGIQQRESVELAGAMCGAKRDLGTSLVYRQVDSVQLAEKAATFQQATGRGQSRVTVDGKALPQISFLIYKNSRHYDLTGKIAPWFPEAQWVKYKPVFCDEAEEGLMETWTEKVQEYLEGLPQDQTKVGSKTVKKAVHAEGVVSSTWARITKAEYDGWRREGQTFVSTLADDYDYSENVA